MGYSDIYEALVEPKTCATCEFNFTGHGEKEGKRVCGGGDLKGRETGHPYGHIITDENDTCPSWGASYGAYATAYNAAKKNEAKKPGRRKNG